MSASKEFIAHLKENGETQSVSGHLLGVSALSHLFAEKIGLGLAGELIGLLHDLGKYSSEFQAYLLSAAGLLEQDKDDQYVDASSKKGKIDHSTAGAQIIWSELSQRCQVDRVTGQILALCIASHHSGLIDCLAVDGSDNFTRRMHKADALTHRYEVWKQAGDNVRDRFDSLIQDSDLTSSFRKIIGTICQNERSGTIIRFKVGLLVRYLFACLIDADRMNTADFGHPMAAKRRLLGRYEEWPVLIGRLERRLADFGSGTRIDTLRREIADHCLAAAGRGKGIFSLTVPTGGGKTLASLRFALRHAEKHGMDRIFFVIPYTSIIDQNADNVRAILEPREDGIAHGSVVLEHHSNLTPEKQTWRSKILSENWDAPVVFTTSVQLLESLFGTGTRGARRMHQLANSVIVFDEIQTLPINCTHLFNNAVNFLVEQCRSSVLLCTATQPLLDKVDEQKGAIRLTIGSEIIPDVEALFRELKRVVILDQRKPGGWTHEELKALALREVELSGSCLVVVNTKSVARAIYRLCRDAMPNLPIYHLSTNMCPAHRKSCLSRLKEHLTSNVPSLCVSTQLIEAGVDIDFGAVVRFTAGLDSIAQAAGRCNRNGAREPGRVHVVNPAEDGADVLKDIRAGKEVAERIMDEMPKALGSDEKDVLRPDVMQNYFKYYFFGRAKEMDYPVTAEQVGRDDTLLRMLSENSMAVAASGQIPPNYFRQSFMTAAEAFKSIDAPTQGVIVPHENGKELISELCAAFDVEKQYELLKHAQQFTVNIFSHTMQHLQKENALHEVQKDTGILYLDARYYDPEFGLSERPVNLMETLNV